VQHWAVVDLSLWMLDYVENKLQINKSIKVRCDFPPGLMIFVDQFQLDMVVRNLLENAEHAMIDLPDNSPRVITLSTCEQGEYALLRVRDSGQGLERVILKKAFEPLFSTKQYGFGMGLTLSRNLVEFLGGELQLSSQGEMQGAVALLRLPLASSNNDEPSSEQTLA
jgi:signal transduction histidine kinase